MFYMNHSLVSSSEPNSWFKDNPFLNKDTIVQRLTTTPNDYGKYIKDGQYTPGIPYIHVTKNQDCNQASIYLKLPLYTKKGETPEYTCKLANITISSTLYNCGSIHLSNLNTQDGYYTGLAMDFLTYIENWCIWSGYTMLFGNVAGHDQIKLLPEFLARGYTEMGVHYINKRSLNTNIWLQKIIQNQDNIEEEPDDDDDYEEDNSVSDEEF